MARSLFYIFTFVFLLVLLLLVIIAFTLLVLFALVFSNLFLRGVSTLFFFREGGLIFIFFCFYFLILLVVLDSEHLIVLDTKLQQLNCSFIIKWRFLFSKPSQVILNIPEQTFLQCVIHFLIRLILVKTEHIVNIFNCGLFVQVLQYNGWLFKVLVIFLLKEVAVIF